MASVKPVKGIYGKKLPNGNVSEWLMVVVLKTTEGNTSAGSNPAISAKYMLAWSSRLARHPFKVETLGSNPTAGTSQYGKMLL